MKPCLGRLSCVCLLLAAGLSPTWAKGAEPRLVADEFQETLARISALAPAQVARSPGVSAAARPGSCAWPFTKPAAARSRASTNWRSSVPTGKRTSPWPSAAPWPARRRCFPVTHPPDQAPERRPLRKRPQLDRRDQRPRVGADRIARAGHRGQRPDHPRPHRQVPRPHPGGVRGARLAGRAAVAVGRQARADGPEPGPPACPTFRSTGCRRRRGTDSCSTRFCASGRRGATSRRTITCRRCWSIGRPCPAARRTGAASRGWRRWSGCWCCSRS